MTNIDDVILGLVAKLASVESGIQNLTTSQEETRAMIKQFMEKNDKEHGEFAKQKDVDNLAARLRILESLPDKQKAKVFDEVKKYIFAFLGGGLFLFLITNLSNIINFISALGRK